MYFIPVKCNCRVFYASCIFQWILALPKPWTRTSFTCRPGAAVASWALPNTRLLSVGGALPLGRKSASFFAPRFILAPLLRPPTGMPVSINQLHYAELVFTGALGGNHILGSLTGSLSTQPHAYGRSLLHSPSNDGNCKLPDGLARKTVSSGYCILSRV